MGSNRGVSARQNLALLPEVAGTRPAEENELPERLWRTTLQFVTPLFGGGVDLSEASKAHVKLQDPVTLVRGASLRGQLRFWWRHACAAGLADNQRREREALLWGWASTSDRPRKGLVSIAVDGRKAVRVREHEVYDRNAPKRALRGEDDLGYGAFPLQPASGQGAVPGTLAEVAGTFEVTLRLRLPAGELEHAAREAWELPRGNAAALLASLGDEVERTWLAFLTFGGLGGRTRRGFGSVRPTGGSCADLSSENVVERLGWTKQVRYTAESRDNALGAQKLALGKLRSFRQGEGVGRNPGQADRPGRSRWPEADTIRTMSGASAPAHRQPITSACGFPRAAFGLPILVQFKDKNLGDPDTTTIKPAGRERLASPLLLAPVKQLDGRWHGAALLLPVEAQTRKAITTVDLSGKSIKPGASKRAGVLGQVDAATIRPVTQNLPASSTPAGDSLDLIYESFFTYFSRNQ